MPNPENILPYRMKPWETLNPNWRPRKGISAVNHELEEKWYKPATKQEIEANYMAMLQLKQEELLELWNNKDKPMLVRILAKNMLDKKGFDIIEKMLDRWIGKAVQKMEWDLNFKWDITVKTPE